MSTQEIPRENWQYYLDALSNRESNHAVTVRLEGAEPQGRSLAQDLPLVGISRIGKGKDAEDIEVVVGGQEQGSPNVTHVVRDPARVVVEETADGRARRVDIEDSAHVKTVIFFQDAVPQGTATR